MYACSPTPSVLPSVHSFRGVARWRGVWALGQSRHRRGAPRYGTSGRLAAARASAIPASLCSRKCGGAVCVSPRHPPPTASPPPSCQVHIGALVDCVEQLSLAGGLAGVPRQIDLEEARVGHRQVLIRAAHAHGLHDQLDVTAANRQPRAAPGETAEEGALVSGQLLEGLEEVLDGLVLAAQGGASTQIGDLPGKTGPRMVSVRVTYVRFVTYMVTYIQGRMYTYRVTYMRFVTCMGRVACGPRARVRHQSVPSESGTFQSRSHVCDEPHVCDPVCIHTTLYVCDLPVALKSSPVKSSQVKSSQVKSSRVALKSSQFNSSQVKSATFQSRSPMTSRSSSAGLKRQSASSGTSCARPCRMASCCASHSWSK